MKHALKVHMAKIVPMYVNVIMVLNALQNLVCVYVQLDGEDNNVICHVKNRTMAKIVKMNVNVKMMQRVVQLMVYFIFYFNLIINFHIYAIHLHSININYLNIYEDKYILYK